MFVMDYYNYVTTYPDKYTEKFFKIPQQFQRYFILVLNKPLYKYFEKTLRIFIFKFNIRVLVYTDLCRLVFTS